MNPATGTIPGASPGNLFNNRISEREALQYYNTPQQQYEVLLRNNFYLPAYKSPLVNGRWMDKVMTGKVWVPRCDEV